MALIYIDRLIQRNNFLLTELNVHRVIVTAILLAAKFFDDAYYNNAYYAKVGGVLVSEMNGLEVDFLFRINFSLHVTPGLFDQYRVELLSHSGTDSLPLPLPPSPQLSHQQQQYEQQQIQQQQYEQQQIQQQQYEQQLMQQQQEAAAAAMRQMQTEQLITNSQVASLNLQAVAAVAAASQAVSASQITPSPPVHTVTSSNAAAANQQMVEDEVMQLRSNLPNLFPNEFGFLQRANSLPPALHQNKSLAYQMQNVQPLPPQPSFSAPAMMDPFVALEQQHQAYQQAAAAAQAAAGLVSQHHQRLAADLIHHVHHPQPGVVVGSQLHYDHHHHHVPGFVSREAAVSQRFAAAGQMVAGVSGGL